ncbi:MAG TPA: hypothetical protein DEQ80_04585 [Anaerolinea thermolimosa]|uniref:Uncharacterized protein n=1 Tax=Anaerolinea thermolimosa TaxID=229919 RepID=A0A3D1JHM3_9CHLR|nr:hypothetical protein [Anaerolinea thermolimosa]
MQRKSFFPPVCCFLVGLPFPLHPLRRRLTGNPGYDDVGMVLTPRSFPLQCDDVSIIGEIGWGTREKYPSFGPGRVLVTGRLTMVCHSQVYS